MSEYQRQVHFSPCISSQDSPCNFSTTATPYSSSDNKSSAPATAATSSSNANSDTKPTSSTVTRTMFLPVRSTRTPITGAQDDSSKPKSTLTGSAKTGITSTPAGAAVGAGSTSEKRIHRTGPIRTNLSTSGGGPRPPPPPSFKSISVPIPVSVAHSHSSGSQAYLTPQDAHPQQQFHSFQAQGQQNPNPRESIASSFQTEPSSYYSAEDDSFSGLGGIGEEEEIPEVPPFPNPHSLSKEGASAPQSQRQTTISSPATSSTATILNPRENPTTKSAPTSTSSGQGGLAYRNTSTRTTASTSTHNTTSTGLSGRSGSIGVSSLVEPSRQSTSDSHVYPKGNNNGAAGTGKDEVGGGAESGAVKTGEDELARLVAGLEELVEEPEYEDGDNMERGNEGWMKMPEPRQHHHHTGRSDFDDQQRKKGKMKMPEPQHYTSHATREENDSQSDDDDDDRYGRAPVVPQVIGTRVRKISPLMIPPTPKSPPPVPSGAAPSGHLRTRSGSAGRRTEEKNARAAVAAMDTVPGAHGRMGSSSSTANPNPSAGQRHVEPRVAPRITTTTGGPSRSQNQTQHRPSEIQKTDSGSSSGADGRPYGSLTITSVATSRVERPSSGSAAAHPPRSSFSPRESSATVAAAGAAAIQRRHGSTGSGHTPYPSYGKSASSPTTTTGQPPQEKEREKVVSMAGTEKTYPSPIETNRPRPPFAPPFPKTRRPPLPPIPNSSPHLSNNQGRQRGGHQQMDTQYVNMLLAMDDIPTTHNLLAAFFNWIYLAGFVLFPGTFTSLKALTAENGGTVPGELVNTVTQLPL